jgi:Uma2 family endonuclease
MSTAVIPILLPGVVGQHIVLEDVSWDQYEEMLKQVKDAHFQLTFDQGRLEIMSPLPEHEWIKQLVGAMVTLIALERNIPMRQLGQTTYRRRQLRKGLEPDQCYYVQNERKIRSRNDLDFNVDPVPDLAIEADVTSRSIDRLPIYAALGVAEIWRHDGRQLTCLHLNAGGTFEPAEMSLAFPFLRVAELNRFLEMWSGMEETALLRAFRDWVREIN